MAMVLRVVNFATSKNLSQKYLSPHRNLSQKYMSPHRNFHKYTWTYLDGKTHDQIDHVLIERRRHSSVLDVRSFRTAECDTDHYLV
jgi:hypothetical protein